MTVAFNTMNHIREFLDINEFISSTLIQTYYTKTTSRHSLSLNISSKSSSLGFRIQFALNMNINRYGCVIPRQSILISYDSKLRAKTYYNIENIYFSSTVIPQYIIIINAYITYLSVPLPFSRCLHMRWVTCISKFICFQRCHLSFRKIIQSESSFTKAIRRCLQSTLGTAFSDTFMDTNPSRKQSRAANPNLRNNPPVYSRESSTGLSMFEFWLI